MILSLYCETFLPKREQYKKNLKCEHGDSKSLCHKLLKI